MQLRWATTNDLDQMLQIKQQLRRSPTTLNPSQGGFLLGSSPEHYVVMIQQALVLVLEDLMYERLAGFAIGLPDSFLRQTDVWQRRHQIRWCQPELDLETLKLGYFEQLAVLPNARDRFYAPALACALGDTLFQNHDFVFSTVVEAPVANLASRPLLRWLGADRLGEIEEVYPEVGEITSGIYGLDRSAYKARMASLDRPGVMPRRIFRMIEDLTEAVAW